MYCKECGTQIDDDSKFCAKCGTKQFSQPIQSDSKAKTGATQIKDDFKKSIPSFSQKPQKQKSPLDEKYDKSKKIDFGLIILGLALIFLNYLWMISVEKMEQNALLVISIISIIIRVLLAMWIINIVKSNNRDTWGWGIFGLFFPSLALIFCGFQKKLLYPQNFNSLTDEQKSLINSRISFNRRFNHMYEDAIVFSSKAIEYNKQNYEAYNDRAYTNIILHKYKDSIIDLNSSLEIKDNQPNVYYNRGLAYEKIGDAEKMLSDWEVAKEMGHSIAKMKIEKLEN